MVPPAMWTITARKAASARRVLRAQIAKTVTTLNAKIPASANRMRPVVRLTVTVRWVIGDAGVKRVTKSLFYLSTLVSLLFDCKRYCFLIDLGICDGYCSGNGECEIRLANPTCLCNQGYWGKQCQSDTCLDYCKNGGVCTNENSRMMSCECPSHYKGNRCEIPVWCPKGDCDDIEPCTHNMCMNGGTCQIIRGMPVCNCTAEWYGNVCQNSGSSNTPCADYCENNGVCQFDGSQYPTCICVGDWVGRKCNHPPPCSGGCGECKPSSSVNECQCIDGSISPCIREAAETIASSARDETGHVLTVLCVILAALILLIALFGGGIFFLR